MNLNISRDWLLRMAEMEGNGIISVGGLVTTLNSMDKNNSIPLIDEESILRRANEIADRHGFRAELLPGVRSVGIGGDARLYMPVIVLVGPRLGLDDEVLAQLSTEISNNTGGCRVTIDITPVDAVPVRDG
jgi:hypothetical protein